MKEITELSSFSQFYARIFAIELEKVYQKEKGNPEFLNQEDFKTLRERAQAAVDIVVEQVVVKLALDIGSHREKEHGDSQFEKEQTELLSMLNEEYNITSEEVAVWWYPG